MPPVYKLMTVNTVPERAKRLIGRVIEDVKDRWTIQYVANAESACEVPLCRRQFPPEVRLASQR